MAVSPKGMYTWDWVIFVGMLIGTLAIGIYHAFAGGKQRTTSEYLLGNRKIHCFPASISMTASFFSSILMLGFPAEAYTNGGGLWLYAVGIAMGASLSCVLFVPVFHPLKLTSVNDYLYSRFNSRLVSILGTLSAISGQMLYTSIVYFAPATAFQNVTGFPTWASILIGSSLTILYTTIGGIKAVIWTDVFQAALMLVGLLTMAITATLKIGSLSEVWTICRQWDRLNIIDVNPDVTQRLTLWSVTIGVAALDINRFGCQQAAIQRYCTMPTLTKARLCVLGLIPFTTTMTSLASFTGLAIFAYYSKEGCDPIRGKLVRNANQLVPHFVSETINYPAVMGLLLASIVSASLSTASSALNSTAANVWKDIISIRWPDLSERTNVIITKSIVVIFGAASTGLAFMFSNLGGTVIQMVVTFSSACGGPTTAMFLMGILFPFTNWIGVSIGGVTGFIFALWIGFGAYSINNQRVYLPTTIENCPGMNSTGINSTLTTITPSALLSTLRPTNISNPLHKLYSISYLWIALFSMIVAIAVGVLVSLLTGCDQGKPIAAKYIHPWLRKLYDLKDDTERVSGEKKKAHLNAGYDTGEKPRTSNDENVVTKM